MNSTELCPSRTILCYYCDIKTMQETSYGTDIAIVPRKSYIILKRRKSFALNRVVTRDRLNLRLKLTGCRATGML